MLSARNLSVEIGGRVLLNNISLDVAPGQILAIVGPNGAGKSTLLKALAGEIRPSQGEIRMNGKALPQWSTIERARLRAVLPQDSTLTFAFTVLEVVLLGRTPHVMGSRLEDIDIARSALAEAGVAHLESRIYTTLSGGERQRAHLARVLAQLWESSTEHRYMLLDEPTSSLDLAHQHNALRVARGVASRGVGVLAVLHDLNLAAQYADRIVALSHGRTVHDGPPGAVLTPDIIHDVFGITAVVQPHPRLACPLVVPMPADR